MGRIVSLAEVIAFGGLKAELLDGQMFEGLIDTAEDYVERFCGRRFSPDPALASDGSDTLSPVAKSFAVSPGQRTIRIPDLRVVTAVTLNGAALPASSSYTGGYRLDNYADPATRLYLDQTGLTQSWAGVPGPGVLVVTGRWGWLEPPAPIKRAVSALTMRMYRERDAVWANTVEQPDGSILSYTQQLPASIQAMLLMYRSGPKLALV